MSTFKSGKTGRAPGERRDHIVRAETLGLGTPNEAQAEGRRAKQWMHSCGEEYWIYPFSGR